MSYPNPMTNSPNWQANSTPSTSCSDSLTDQVRRVKRVQQAEQIRDKALETLLEQVEVPLPEAIVAAQVEDTMHNAIHGLDHDEERFAEALAEQGSSREEFDADNRSNAEQAVKTQLLMDAIADELNVQVGQNDLTERLVLMSRQYGLEPQQLLQLPAGEQPAAGHVRRRAAWPDGRGRGARRNGHRHRRQCDRHHGVLRPVRTTEQAAEQERNRRTRGRTPKPTPTSRRSDESVRRHEVTL